MKLKRFFLFIPFLFLNITNLYSQDINQNYLSQQTFGLIIGSSFVDEHLPEGTTYHPIKLIMNYSLPLRKKDKIKRSVFFLHFEPQFNFILIKGGENAIETGVNIGFRYDYLVGQNNIIFAGVGIGPHFITAETSLQANGFIFSDNFYLGYRQKILSKTNPFELSFQTRFRHISNAGIQEPNTGIDNFFFLIGISTLI